MDTFCIGVHTAVERVSLYEVERPVNGVDFEQVAILGRETIREVGMW
jgi:hypothetical protein